VVAVPNGPHGYGRNPFTAPACSVSMASSPRGRQLMTDTEVQETTAEGQPAADARQDMLDTSLRRAKYAQDELIELLHVAQDIYGYLSDDVLLHLARELKLPPSMVYGVATFYHLFTFERPGRHGCTVCTGTACFVKNADAVVAAVRDTFGVLPGETTPDRMLSLTTSRCLGACSLAPVVVIDGTVHGEETPESTVERLRQAMAADEEDAV
jgi:bidirectional [NiFe] hydrogenase diaphorase subunit